MDTRMNPSELPATLSIVPGYSPAFVAQRLWIIVACQVFVCITSSVWVSYYFYKKLYSIKNISWKKAVEIMGPIGKRLQNLEKERAVWRSYLEWIEDYCAVYYGLLNYLNTAATDLDKICNNKTFSWETLSQNSGPMSQTDGDSVMDGESQDEKDFASSEVEWDKVVSDANVNISFAKVSRSQKTSDDYTSKTSWNLNSTAEDLDCKKETEEEDMS